MVNKIFLQCLDKFPYKHEIKKSIEERNLEQLKLYFSKIRFAKRFHIIFITFLIKYSILHDARKIRKYLLANHKKYY